MLLELWWCSAALALGACIPPGKSKSHTLSWFLIFTSTELCPELPLESLPLSDGRETNLHSVGHGGPRGSNHAERAEHLTAATGHLFEEVMATRHPPGVAGDGAETSSNTQCAFRQH